MAYLDTSILVPYYCPEALSPKAQDIILSDDDPAVTGLSGVEIASALSRKIREKQLSVNEARRILNLFDVHLRDGFYRILSLDHTHFALAAEFIRKFSTPLRTLDALHLAAASMASMKLVSADEKLAGAGKALGVPVRLVRIR